MYKVGDEVITIQDIYTGSGKKLLLKKNTIITISEIFEDFTIMAKSRFDDMTYLYADEFVSLREVKLKKILCIK